MCVIVTSADGVVPNVKDLYDCHSTNPDGIGLAWFSKNRGKVKYVKAIQYIEALARLEKIAARNQAYILHFRFATIGEKQDRLCHPFPITSDKKILFSLKGETAAVLAHNGTWRSWPTVFSEEAVERLEKLGWSDSSMIAWLIGKGRDISLPQYGYGHRIATLSVSKGLKLFGDWWKDPKTGINYSNRHWQNVKYPDSCGIISTTVRGHRSSSVTKITSTKGGNSSSGSGPAVGGNHTGGNQVTSGNQVPNGGNGFGQYGPFGEIVGG